MKKIFILLLFAQVGKAQTTLYQGSLNAANISNYYPSFITPNAGWNLNTMDTISMTMVTIQGIQAAAVLVSVPTAGTSPSKILIQKFITPPLIRQILNGTIDAQMKFNMSSVTSQTGQGFIYARLVNKNNTVASELGTMTTTNLTTALTNRTLSQITLTNVTIQEGQRILFEIGWNYLTGTATTTTGTMNTRNVRGAADLPIDNTTTTAANSWIKFSQTLKFQTNSNIF